MSTVDKIKSLERAGFTRAQAEVQVKTIEDMKKGLMTQRDGEILEASLCNELRRVEVQLKSEMGSLKGEVNGVKAEVNSLKSEVNGVKVEVNSLKSEVNGVKVEVGSLKGEINGVKGEIEALKLIIKVVPVQSAFYTFAVFASIFAVWSAFTRFFG